MAGVDNVQVVFLPADSVGIFKDECWLANSSTEDRGYFLCLRMEVANGGVAIVGNIDVIV